MMNGAWKMVLLAAAVVGLALGSGQAIAKEQLIGTAVYEARPQRDIVTVGGKEGQFRAIRFEVKGSDVEVLDLKIVYGNGSGEDIRVRQTFKAGSSSRVIDLAGYRRAIKQIIVAYVARGPARIQFYGVGGTAPALSWENLGCKDVSFGVDHDTLKVGRQDGAFKAVKISVNKAPVEFFGARVVFGNGQRQDLKFRAVIRPGGETRAIDLAGSNRGIDRVELLYRSIPTFKGAARVCLSGLQR